MTYSTKIRHVWGVKASSRVLLLLLVDWHEFDTGVYFRSLHRVWSSNEGEICACLAWPDLWASKALQLCTDNGYKYKDSSGGLYHMGNWDPPNMVVCGGAVSQRVSTNDAFYKSWLVHFNILLLLVYMDYTLTWQLLLSRVSLLLLLNNNDLALKSKIRTLTKK